MPKFKVLVQQYVEQVAYVWIEAEDEEAAGREANNVSWDDIPESHWEPGDDAYKMEAYAVEDESGETVWER